MSNFFSRADRARLCHYSWGFEQNVFITFHEKSFPLGDIFSGIVLGELEPLQSKEVHEFVIYIEGIEHNKYN